MSEVDLPDDFDERLADRVADVIRELGAMPVEFVLAYQVLDKQGRSTEGVTQPEPQLLTHTAGLIRFAQVKCDAAMVEDD